MNPIIYNDYESFIRKFTDKPRTTDDCYTPPEVYDAVLRFIDQHILPLAGRTILRPFYPGGDYEHADYPPGGIVIDNPPFSIYSAIVRFYAARNIPFFLFAPALTAANPRFPAGVCTIITASEITYQNGATVITAFTTNLIPGLRLWTCPHLTAALAAPKKDKSHPSLTLSPHIVTVARLLKIAAHGVELRIGTDECTGVTKANGHDLFGGGFLLSSAARAKAEAARAKAEAARAKAEAARAKAVALSPEERAIIAKLDAVAAGLAAQ